MFSRSEEVAIRYANLNFIIIPKRIDTSSRFYL